MRRTGRESGVARSASGKLSGGRGDPSGAAGRSKPDRPVATAPEATRDVSPGLHLVATPIGNLGDVTLRALEVLRASERIYCEDRRVTARLCARYGITTPLARCDDHNAAEVWPEILAALRRGARLALVSDAGTPLVSDPGYKLVRAAIAENLPVSAVPGPSAALAALVLSGLPPNSFLFSGFLPPRPTARRRTLAERASLDATLIFFESARRLADSLADMAEILGSREAAVARELTKLFEEVRRGPLDDLVRHYRASGPPRGEAVVVVGPPMRAAAAPADVETRLRLALGNCGVREAAAKLALETGLPRRELYRRALAIAGKA